MKIFEELLQAISCRQTVVLCTVIETDRSVPRKAGAKMLVYDDGSTFGTIGGGEMEFRVISAAKESISEKKSRQLSYTLAKLYNAEKFVLSCEITNI